MLNKNNLKLHYFIVHKNCIFCVNSKRSDLSKQSMKMFFVRKAKRWTRSFVSSGKFWFFWLWYMSKMPANFLPEKKAPISWTIKIENGYEQLVLECNYMGGLWGEPLTVNKINDGLVLKQERHMFDERRALMVIVGVKKDSFIKINIFKPLYRFTNLNSL